MPNTVITPRIELHRCVSIGLGIMSQFETFKKHGEIATDSEVLTCLLAEAYHLETAAKTLSVHHLMTDQLLKVGKSYRQEKAE